jgi:hypothetical protein
LWFVIGSHIIADFDAPNGLPVNGVAKYKPIPELSLPE